MVHIKCYTIVAGKEVFILNRDENKFTAQRVKDGDKIDIVGKHSTHYIYKTFSEKDGKAIIEEVKE